jgi:hypothetical protein
MIRGLRKIGERHLRQRTLTMEIFSAYVQDLKALSD